MHALHAKWTRAREDSDVANGSEMSDACPVPTGLHSNNFVGAVAEP
jgi:hypothetical protein